jgi:His/Glu/Gln/Arg/opine family amino acid ABC transporter permease subunit
VSWIEKYCETIIDSGYYKLLLEGFGNTLLITIGALIIGVIIGTIISVTKYFCEDIPAMKPICWLCDLYTTVIRGIPVVVLLLITFLIIFASSNNGVLVAIITFGINSGAYMAELIRSGIQAVDVGQMEAGRSLGLSKLQTMRKIVFPQAVRYILPAIGNEMIALLKETSVAGYVAVRDLTKAGDQIRNNTYDAMNPLLTVAMTYLALVVLMTAVLNKVEKRLAKK